MADPKKPESKPAGGVVATQQSEDKPPEKAKETARKVADKELKAMSAICSELAELDPESQRRIMNYISQRFANSITPTPAAGGEPKKEVPF